MDPKDNLTLATFLGGPPKQAPDQACLRASCGRAYFGAFAHARDLLRTRGFGVPTDDTAHRQLVTYLKQSTDNNVQAAGALLHQLRVERNEADYDVGAQTRGPFQRGRSQLAVIRATTIITELDRASRQDRRLFIP